MEPAGDLFLFTFSHYTIVYRESYVVFVKKFDFRFLTDLSVLGSPESKKVVFKKCLSGCTCVCVCVCMYVCVIFKNRARDLTDEPIFMKFGIIVYCTNISGPFFHFVKFLILTPFFPLKTSKKVLKINLRKNGSNDFD